MMLTAIGEVLYDCTAEKWKVLLCALSWDYNFAQFVLSQLFCLINSRAALRLPAMLENMCSIFFGAGRENERSFSVCSVEFTFVRSTHQAQLSSWPEPNGGEVEFSALIVSQLDEANVDGKNDDDRHEAELDMVRQVIPLTESLIIDSRSDN